MVAISLKDNPNIDSASYAANSKRLEQKEGMFIKDGYINYCILPEAIAKNPAMGPFTCIAYLAPTFTLTANPNPKCSLTTNVIHRLPCFSSAARMH